DIFFQAKESSNKFYDAIPDVVAGYMKEISQLTGREYKPYVYYGHPEAENIIIAMGSVTETIEETIDYLNQKGKKYGLIKIHLYRPFSEKYFHPVVPKTVKKIAVLDRSKEPGALGEPLFLDVCKLFYNRLNAPMIIGGRYGLGSKDTTPSQIKAVFDNLDSATPKHPFTIGIVDDVTHLSLDEKEKINAAPEGTIRCKFWGLGSDGTVGANKNSIKIIGDKTDKYAQGYFAYDSKKSGGVTVSHLRFGDKPIKSVYLIDEGDFVACHNQAYVNQYDLLCGLRTKGTFLLNTQWTDAELEHNLPDSMKKYIAANQIEFYTINATDIAIEIGLGGRINMIMQSAFFKLSKVIPIEKAVEYMKEAVEHTYGKKGEKIIEMNFKAINKGIELLHKVNVPTSWNTLQDDITCTSKQSNKPEFIDQILIPMTKQKGDTLPVSVFSGRENGEFPLGTSAYEKRGIAVSVPEWQKDKCIQCNQCSFICPHASIRPFLMTVDEVKKAPATLSSLKAIGKGLEDLNFKIQVSVLDCTGCGNCADICPSKEKALIMKPAETQTVEKEHWNYMIALPEKKNILPLNSVKNSQFSKPLFEFSGACAGCGETPYTKLITQLFGDRMLIANATGCTSIWGASAPSMPYCKNDSGRGPAWANSLFEDNAEYGLGMLLGTNQLRDKIEMYCRQLLQLPLQDDLKNALNQWLENKNKGENTFQIAENLQHFLTRKTGNAEIDKLLEQIAINHKFLVKKSVWVFGGDGWAYDIGYGGLDHVLATGEDINVMVYDTEVYSNTGGQSSKSTPTAAVAKFAASGKRTKKKDLGMMAISYGYVYVAQVAMGADKSQYLKALLEAEAYPGPSLIIAYSPCINHGLKNGMGKTQEQEKRAVESGYWHLYRYNPLLKAAGKNPFILDSKPPTASFQDFLKTEVRYTSLIATFPEHAQALFDKAEQDAKDRLVSYQKLANVQ
ncbi:MAG: pyruvate:ferredoxin (flavodoxin) oxidoreductase, partial [Caldisericia bacterium]|nr:pyruvate:ferredoxin (flavodoxin) oxidoreductase [Caldisericia bacterium]